MSKTVFAGCPRCARHVRVSEPACPFCGVELAASFRRASSPQAAVGRLGVAALHSLRVGAMTVATAACGGSVAGSGHDANSGPDDATAAMDAPVDARAADVTYDALDAPYDVASFDAPVDSPFIVPPYGAPAPPPPNSSPLHAVIAVTPRGLAALGAPVAAPDNESEPKR